MTNNGLWKIPVPFTDAAPFYGSVRINRNGWDQRSPTALPHRLGAVYHRFHPVSVRVPRLGESGFKSMSNLSLSFPSHGGTPLLTRRGNRTRLLSLGDPYPIEDQDPLSVIDLVEDALDARAIGGSTPANACKYL
jgi:hypothetical protein